jgi:hypothetical protein
MFGAGAPDHGRWHHRRIDDVFVIKQSAVVGLKAAPVHGRSIEGRALGRTGTAVRPGDRALVGGDHAEKRAEFDRQVAQRERASTAIAPIALPAYPG